MPLDERWGHIVGETSLKGAYYRRALVLLSRAESFGGADTEGFRVWLEGAPGNWLGPDKVIMRALSAVPSDPDANS
jgi:hypothetical protein